MLIRVMLAVLSIGPGPNTTIRSCPLSVQIAGTVTGSGRAKLRLSRGFPGYHAPNVLPQTAINRSFEPAALSRRRTQVREGRKDGRHWHAHWGQVKLSSFGPLAVLSEAQVQTVKRRPVGRWGRSKGIRCVGPTFAWGQVTYWA